MATDPSLSAHGLGTSPRHPTSIYIFVDTSPGPCTCAHLSCPACSPARQMPGSLSQDPLPRDPAMLRIFRRAFSPLLPSPLLSSPLSSDRLLARADLRPGTSLRRAQLLKGEPAATVQRLDISLQASSYSRQGGPWLVPKSIGFEDVADPPSPIGSRARACGSAPTANLSVSSIPIPIPIPVPILVPVPVRLPLSSLPRNELSCQLLVAGSTSAPLSTDLRREIQLQLQVPVQVQLQVQLQCAYALSVRQSGFQNNKPSSAALLCPLLPPPKS
ncbi:unnamed protein product [Diplocarpon coronariae]